MDIEHRCDNDHAPNYMASRRQGKEVYQRYKKAVPWNLTPRDVVSAENLLDSTPLTLKSIWCPKSLKEVEDFLHWPAMGWEDMSSVRKFLSSREY